MFNADEIIKAAKGKIITGPESAQVKGVSVDSRTIKKGELFIAIKGARCDGHKFIDEAFRKGAAGALVCSRNMSPRRVTGSVTGPRRFIISVTNTVKALGEIARFRRERFDIPIVAVTGSNGKTTAKEMIENTLRREWSPLKNFGTQNNLIGVPLSLLKLTKENKSAVLELGMNRPGEIKQLAGIIKPNIGAVTNIGPSHLKYLKSLKAVYCAKKELLDYLGKWDTAVLNSDDYFLSRFRKKTLRIFTFGIKAKADFQAKSITKKGGGWKFNVRGKPYFIPLAACHDIYNALIAISIGTLFNVKSKEIANALRKYKPLERRMTRSLLNGIEFIDDTYNSNPLSLESAVRTLVDCRTKGRRILVSGDMLELGGKAVYYHSKIGRLVARSGIDNFISVGGLMRNSYRAARQSGMKNSWFCSSKEDAAALLKQIAKPNDVVLVKGSRATQMEDVIKCFITLSTR
jgi:UDP-N-acetylmuramoyl-tripeptide--D-alanyl-D-alanine ligase